jgi:hypothetical protein
MLDGSAFVHHMDITRPLEYQYGRLEKRWIWFGAERMRWRSISREKFYRWLKGSGALGRADFGACDVLLLAGFMFPVGPYTLRAVPK